MAFECIVRGQGRAFSNTDKRYILEGPAEYAPNSGETANTSTVWQIFRNFASGNRRIHVRTANTVSWNVGDVVTVGVEFRSAGTQTLTLTAPSASIGGGSSAILDQSDFTYVGTSQFPQTWSSLDTLYTTSALAYRYVSGTRRFFTRIGSDIVEYTASPGSAPVFVANHGKIWNDYEESPGIGQTCHAMHFHQTNADGSGYLWMLHAYFYHTTGANDPHVSVATFSGGSYVSTAGPLTTPSTSGYNKTRSGLTGWTGGDMLIGAGGHYAGVSSASLGFHCASMSPTPPGGSSISATTLVDHPYNSITWATSMRRLGDYSSTGNPDSPDAGIWPQPDGGSPPGKWQYYDGIDCMCYVDTGTKKGVIIAGEEATGDILYTSGGGSPGTIWKTYWRIFDPDLIASNGGSTLAPTRYFRIAPGSFGDANYGRELGQRYDGGNPPLSSGMCYDSTAGQLIVFHHKLAKTSGGAPDYERLPGLMFYSV